MPGPANLLCAHEEEILASVPDPKKYNDEVLWPDKVSMNLEYFYNHNFAGDLLIILKTPKSSALPTSINHNFLYQCFQ